MKDPNSNDPFSDLDFAETNFDVADTAVEMEPGDDAVPIQRIGSINDHGELDRNEIALNDDLPESLASKLRLILWERDQIPVALILASSLVLMTVYFSGLWIMNQGLVDIDDSPSIQAEFKVDINSAELGEIVVLPGVGVKLAQAIVEHRRQTGKFDSLDELRDVPGIGTKKLESLKPFLLPVE